jgi:UDP-N-acetylglucosamine 2-epimerase (non-hydrolysing)
VMSKMDKNWEVPTGYLTANVSETVVKFLLGGKRHV